MDQLDRSANLIAGCTTAPTLNQSEQELQRLTNAVLAGKAEEVRQSTYTALARGSSPNDILDALVEAANIIIDLHEVGEFDQSRLSTAENAVSSCLQVIEDRLAKSEGKFNVKATVGPLGLKAGSVLSLALSAILRSVGFRAMNLSKTQTPLELLRNSEELGAELVIPLLSSNGVEGQLRSLVDEVERGGFKSKFEVIAVAPGLPATVQTSLSVVRNSGEAISKATEWALKRQGSRLGQ